jgi:hypothetical protein
MGEQYLGKKKMYKPMLSDFGHNFCTSRHYRPVIWDNNSSPSGFFGIYGFLLYHVNITLAVHTFNHACRKQN